MNTPVVFRWSIWGDKRAVSAVLRYSIASFRSAFGADASYVVCTDEASEVRELVPQGTLVVPYEELAPSPFNVQARPTWRKWFPTRFAPGTTEFYVDSDVFVVSDPFELRRFCDSTWNHKYCVMQEADGSPRHVGKFVSKITNELPPLNTGLVGQHASADLTSALTAEFVWWATHVPATDAMFHDDQGAVIAVLEQLHRLNLVELLPQERYCVVSPLSNSHLSSVENVAVIHATHQQHPAFSRFREKIGEFIAHGRGDVSC